MAIETIDVGDRVSCDDCNKEWKAEDPGKGGVLFGSKAYCPDCAPNILNLAKQFGEEQYIRGRQPDELTFHAWVMQLRGGDNTVTVRSGQDAIDAVFGNEDGANG